MNLNLANFSLLLLGVSGGLVAFSFLFSVWLKRRAETKNAASYTTCRLCLRVYESHAPLPVSRCPDCGAENQR